MKHILYLFAGSVLATQFEYQKVGQCGVPAKGFDDSSDTQIWSDAPNRKKRDTADPNKPLRIVGGSQAKANTWPWQIHLSVCGRWYGILECNICGGSLVHPKFIISAAHCVPDGAAGTVILGADNVQDGGQQRIAVERFVQHPKWGAVGGKMFDHDMSILVLKDKAEMTAQVSPVCLPADNSCFQVDTQCVVTGWGLLSEQGGFPEHLQEVSVRLMNLEDCKQWSGYNDLSENMICAGYPQGKQDACAGDSGGPLVCRHPSGAWILHGVVSWGYGCARENSPGIYARVSRLKQFIKDVTTPYLGEGGLVSDPELELDDSTCDGVACSLTDDKSTFNDVSQYDHVSSVDRCLSVDDETQFNSKWYEQYKKERESNPWANADDSDSGTPESNCRVKEMPNIEDDLDVTSAQVGAAGGKLETVKEGASAYQTGQQCEWRFKPDVSENSEEFVKITVMKNTAINCRGQDALKIKPMDHGARTYKMCKVRRDVSFNSEVGIQLTWTSDMSQDGRSTRATGFKIEYRYMSRTMMCDSSPIVYLGDVDEVRAALDTERGTGDNPLNSIQTKTNGYRQSAGRIFFDLKSESFPAYYSMNSQCRWHIKLLPGQKLCYNIRIFRTERNRYCNRKNDVLVAFSAANCRTDTLESADVSFAMCGYRRRSFYNQHIPAPTDNGNDMCWVFVADNDSRRNRGFWIELWSVPENANCRSYRAIGKK